MFIDRIRDENVIVTNPIKANHMGISAKEESADVVIHKEIPTPSILNRLDVSELPSLIIDINVAKYHVSYRISLCTL